MNTMFEENVRLSASRQCENWNSESQIIIALHYGIIMEYYITDYYGSMTNIRIFTGKCHLN